MTDAERLRGAAFELLEKIDAVGTPDGEESDRVFARYEFEDLRSALTAKPEVCVWEKRKNITGADFWYTTCPDEPRRFAYNLGEYCPGCGKPIEVKE